MKRLEELHKIATDPNADMNTRVHANNEMSDLISAREVSMPPHDDEIEVALLSQISNTVDSVDARNKETLNALYAELNQLTRFCELSSRRAKAALEAHVKTSTVVATKAKEVKDVLTELGNGHIQIAKINGNGANHG